MSEKAINKDVGRNAQETANLIWNAANSLFGAFKPHEYGLVILPMCVIKRFHDCLANTREAVWEANEKFANLGDRKVPFLKRASGYQFYNTSKYTFESLKTDAPGIEENFEDFLNGFSDNVQSILSRMNFHAQIERMKEAKVLYQIICDFSTEDLDMSEASISTVDMGYIFENLVQRFSESYDEEAGAHFTSRDIIYLMCDLLTHDTESLKDKDGVHCTVYDMTMGTSQMLTCMVERIKDKYKDVPVDIQTFGQEINPFTMGIAEADTLIHGGNPYNMKFGNTLSEDQFEGYHFDFVISNPPFGIDWKRESKVVEKEHKLGEKGRFGPGLPAKGDGQMLFLLNGVAKLKEDSGKMAIIQNGSSLFTGDAESGPSEIRRYLIEKDWLDTIIQLPIDCFYNTGISTYIWIVDKAKPYKRPGKIQLIDATQCFELRRRSIGNKRADINEACVELIKKAYANYITYDYYSEVAENKTARCRSIVVDSNELGYQKIIVEQPLLDEKGVPVRTKNKLVPDPELRDTENVPLGRDPYEYIETEIKPFAPNAWFDPKKIKIGYEIPMTRFFFEFPDQEPADEILEEIKVLKNRIVSSLTEVIELCQ